MFFARSGKSFFNTPRLLTVAAVLSPLAACLSAAPVQAASSLGVYLSAPGSQTTIYSQTTVETFESLAVGNRTTNYVSAIGTYQLGTLNPFNIQADNQYGTGTGNYMAIGSQANSSAPITLQFTQAQQYFGFSWNAGDTNNQLTFYKGSNVVGNFTASLLTNLLKNSTVKSVDGTTYTTDLFYGKPGSGATQAARLNNAEPYAFVNFIASDATFSFDRIVLSNSGTTGTGFESDNHTIRLLTPTLDQKSVFAGSVSTPEPGSVALLGTGLLGFAGVWARRRTA